MHAYIVDRRQNEIEIRGGGEVPAWPRADGKEDCDEELDASKQVDNVHSPRSPAFVTEKFGPW